MGASIWSGSAPDVWQTCQGPLVALSELRHTRRSRSVTGPVCDPISRDLCFRGIEVLVEERLAGGDLLPVLPKRPLLPLVFVIDLAPVFLVVLAVDVFSDSAGGR